MVELKVYINPENHELANHDLLLQIRWQVFDKHTKNELSYSLIQFRLGLQP